MNVLTRYIWWTEERGTLHYDVMVTVILLFLFVSPRFINFKAKPMPDAPLPAESVLVKDEGRSGQTARFLYEIPVGRLQGAASDADIRSGILGVVEPMAGTVRLEDYSAVRDGRGHVIAYEALVRRDNQ